MNTARALILGAVIAMAVGCAASYPSKISDISGTDTINQLSADSAPQQAVVNGWTARDYLQLIAQQNTEHNAVLYAVLGLLVLIALLLVRQNRSLTKFGANARPRPDAPTPTFPTPDSPA